MRHQPYLLEHSEVVSFTNCNVALILAERHSVAIEEAVGQDVCGAVVGVVGQQPTLRQALQAQQQGHMGDGLSRHSSTNQHVYGAVVG